MRPGAVAWKLRPRTAAPRMEVAPIALPDLEQIPAPSERRLAMRVTAGARRALRAGHPWVFEESITHQSADGRPGDLAVIFDERRRFLAIGLYDPTSPLRVRILQHGEPREIDRSWLTERLRAAMARRADLPSRGTTGFRIVHAESDGLPGLVVDRYESTLVIALDTAAWVPRLADVRDAVLCLSASERIVLRLARRLGEHPEWLWGLGDGTTIAGTPPDGPVAFRENGLRFVADVVHGQKTGFFFDQRDNRAFVQGLASGRRTLDVFAYTGAFAVYAARGGSPDVVAVDASGAALAYVRRHFELNRRAPLVAAAQHAEVEDDAFRALARLRAEGERFALVVVDPPSFARREADVPAALRSYRALASLAVALLEPGGVLVSSSCSSRVTASAFYDAVLGGAREHCRWIDEIARTGHALDHPVSFREGAYLKCLFATVW